MRLWPRARWFTAGLTLLTLDLTQASPCAAAPPGSQPSAAAKRAAKQHAAAASSALSKGDAETAVREFTLADAAAPSADTKLALARAYRLQGENLQARGLLEAFLADSTAGMGAAKRAEVEAELAQIKGKIAVLTLQVSEVGASVRIDDRELGVTPLAKPLELTTGAHELVVGKAGFVSVTRKLELTSGEQRIDLVIAPEVKTGRLVVAASDDPTMHLFLNEKDVGTLPFQGDLPPGTYKLHGVGSKARTAPQTVEVRVGEVQNLPLTASALPGSLRVNAGDPEASIYLDGKLVGKATWHGDVASGAHQLRIDRPGYAAYEQSLDVSPTDQMVIDQIAYTPLQGGANPARGPEYEGIFVNVALAALFGPSSTNTIAVDCPANSTGGTCESTAPVGGGLGVRVGYSFGWAALEGIALGGADVSTTDASYAYGTPPDLGDYYGAARDEHYAFVRYGFGLGGGARVISKDSLVRFSGGLDGALLYRIGQYARETTTTKGVPDAQQHTSETTHYFAPALLADIGVLIGSTPGVKFHTGVLVGIEFGPEHASVPATSPSSLGGNNPNLPQDYGTPALDVSRGTQVSVGPFLAMQFGH